MEAGLLLDHEIIVRPKSFPGRQQGLFTVGRKLLIMPFFTPAPLLGVQDAKFLTIGLGSQARQLWIGQPLMKVQKKSPPVSRCRIPERVVLTGNYPKCGSVDVGKCPTITPLNYGPSTGMNCPSFQGLHINKLF